MPKLVETCELHVERFDLALTLGSGQFFRVTSNGPWFRIVRGYQVFEVRQVDARVQGRGIGAADLGHFLGLGSDTLAAHERLAGHSCLRPALAGTSGLTVLRQDPWECLVAFHCSTVSNIRRIQGQVEALARAFGRPIARGPLQAWAFPRPGDIRPGPALRAVRLGFREARLLALQEMVDESWLGRLAALPEESQRELLMSLPGVGPKVADCALLFALGRGRAFPIDVWVRRAVRGMAPRGAKTYDRIRAWAVSTFGEDAGLAQQALFVWARSGGLDGHARKRTSRIRSAARPSP